MLDIVLLLLLSSDTAYQAQGCIIVAYEYVTCGSALKLLNTGHNVRLHSHDVKYGSGSGQQVSSSFMNKPDVMLFF